MYIPDEKSQQTSMKFMESYEIPWIKSLLEAARNGDPLPPSFQVGSPGPRAGSSLEIFDRSSSRPRNPMEVSESGRYTQYPQSSSI